MIREALETQIKDNYDVAVCGGGVAGIAAAIAAARLGKMIYFNTKIEKNQVARAFL